MHSPRIEPVDDDWDSITSTIELDTAQFTPDALRGLNEFSHIEVVFRVRPPRPGLSAAGARHPRDNPDWPEVGIFAQRNSNRSNLIGVTVCRLLALDGLSVTVEALDANDGTPVLDIKPYVQEYAPRGEVREPEWTRELMQHYWRA